VNPPSTRLQIAKTKATFYFEAISYKRSIIAWLAHLTANGGQARP
jgi:hypothetical protein